jgi:hypothetical protein
MRWLLPPFVVLAAACGCQPPAAGPAAESPTSPAPPSAASPVYDLHEWGVVAVRAGTFEVAAGPGLRAAELPMAVDKPVLYVHPEGSAPFDLDVRVALGTGLAVAEYFPPTTAEPLAWHARVEGSCRGAYPTDVDARCIGGYCEIGDLATYETDDAACLAVGETRAPLLFYRLWAADAAEAPPLPIRVTPRGAEVVVTNTGIATPVGGLWRVTRVDGNVRAARIDVPAMNREATMPMPTGDAAAGHADMLRMLEAQGLTREEARAFDRGWGSALFGLAAASSSDEDVGDIPPADDQPVDRLSADETIRAADMPAAPEPRDEDVLLYWLPATNIDAIARIEATPAPRALRRAFLVRHVLR